VNVAGNYGCAGPPNALRSRHSHQRGENGEGKLRAGILGGLAGLIIISGSVSLAQAAYPGVNGPLVYEHKTGQFATKSKPFTITPGVPASAKVLASFREDTTNFEYAPNGQKLAFEASASDFPSEIFVIKANGRNPRSVTAKAKPCLAERFPTWSPDGKSIAFQCLRKSDLAHELYSIKLDGSGLKRLTTGASAYQPSWSPLGDKIAYTTYGGSINMVPAGGGPSTLLSEEGPGGVFGGSWQKVDWAPDGQALVGEALADSLYTINPTTGATSGKLAVNGAEPAFSPDGTKIAYVNFAQNLSGGKLEIWMMNANGTGHQQVTTGGYDRAPNWGPAP
jgi:Tol biopolymer transport system component